MTFTPTKASEEAERDMALVFAGWHPQHDNYLQVTRMQGKAMSVLRNVQDAYEREIVQLKRDLRAAQGVLHDLQNERPVRQCCFWQIEYSGEVSWCPRKAEPGSPCCENHREWLKSQNKAPTTAPLITAETPDDLILCYGFAQELGHEVGLTLGWLRRLLVEQGIARAEYRDREP